MSKNNFPKKGSLAYNPRKRAKSQMPNINFWPQRSEKGLLGFAGYKAGMTSISFIDDSNSPSKNNEVYLGATILEVPPMTVYGIRAFKNKQVLKDKMCEDAKILKEMGMKLKKKNEIKAEECDDIYVLAYAKPKTCGFGKKHIERMMIGVGGKSVSEKLEYANSVLGKEVNASDVFKIGEFVDTFAITKGKGWQGTVKRFNTSIQRRKATGKRRHIGTLGPFHPGYVQHTVPRPGQMGYHPRLELNKRIMQIAKPEQVNPSGGFAHYGLVKNPCLIVLGSLSGPQKRLVRMRKAQRNTDIKAPEMRNISLESKQ